MRFQNKNFDLIESDNNSGRSGIIFELYHRIFRIYKPKPVSVSVLSMYLTISGLSVNVGQVSSIQSVATENSRASLQSVSTVLTTMGWFRQILKGGGKEKSKYGNFRS